MHAHELGPVADVGTRTATARSAGFRTRAGGKQRIERLKRKSYVCATSNSLSREDDHQAQNKTAGQDRCGGRRDVEMAEPLIAPVESQG